MSFRNISSWAIRNPIPTTVLFLLLTLGGIFAFPTLRVNNTPDIDLPAVLVSILQPGAAPSELETQVTRRVEDAVAGLGDAAYRVHYDDYVADPEVLRGLFDWLGEVYDQDRVESVLATPHSRRGNHKR